MTTNRLLALQILVFSLIALSVTGQTKVFWSNNATGSIKSANLNGTDVETVIQNNLFFEDVAYNPDDRMIYYVLGSGGPLSHVAKINPDGSGNTILRDFLSSPDGLDLDLCEGKVYFAESGPQIISKMDFDGSNWEVVVTGAVGIEGMAIDPVMQKIYWINTGGGTIMRANYDGTDIQTVVSGLTGPIKLAKDMNSGVVYFTEFIAGRVSKVNGDGTGLEVLISGLNSPSAIAIDLNSGLMYFGDNFGVSQANLDGSQVTPLIDDPGGLKLGLSLNDNSNACNVVPTMGEWGLIILGMSLLIIGVVSVRYRKWQPVRA